MYVYIYIYIERDNDNNNNNNSNNNNNDNHNEYTDDKYDNNNDNNHMYIHTSLIHVSFMSAANSVSRNGQLTLQNTHEAVLDEWR